MSIEINELMEDRKRLADLKNKRMLVRGKDGGGIVREFQMDRCTLLYVN